MYLITNKEEAIRELQKYLYGLENLDNPPAPTGIYDDRTRAGVEAVQEKAGLTVSGTADMETFNLIYKEYRAALERDEARRNAGGALSFPVSFGDYDGRIFEINEALSRLADYYGEGHRIRRGSFFGEESARITAVLREVYGLLGGGEIDEHFYTRMYRDIESINSFKE